MAHKTTKRIMEAFEIKDFRPKNLSPSKPEKSKIFPGQMALHSSATSLIQCPKCGGVMHVFPRSRITEVCACGLVWNTCCNNTVIVTGHYKEDVED